LLGFIFNPRRDKRIAAGGWQIFPVYNLRPRRPPFLRVESDGMGVTSSILPIFIPDLKFIQKLSLTLVSFSKLVYWGLGTRTVCLLRPVTVYGQGEGFQWTRYGQKDKMSLGYRLQSAVRFAVCIPRLPINLTPGPRYTD